MAPQAERDPRTALTDLLEADAPVIVELVAALDTPAEADALDRVRRRSFMRLDAGRPEGAPLAGSVALADCVPRGLQQCPGLRASMRWWATRRSSEDKKITGVAGTDYRNHLIAWIADWHKKGSADLVAYFFLNATKVCPSFGFLATNTIAQGDTSEVGLTQIIDAWMEDPPRRLIN